MWLLPNLTLKLLFARWYIPGAMQPSMPIRAYSACLRFAIIDHPPSAIVFSAIISITIVILTHAYSLAPSEKLSIKRLAVPPNERAQYEIHNLLQSPFYFT